MQTPSSAAPAATRDAAEAVVARVVDGRTRIREELQKVIVGQHEAVDLVLTALFTGGHCLITGVPGLAKTLLIKSLAEILDLSFKRIQFTPDLMPADITGTEILDESSGTRVLRFVQGPIFAQIVLADEVNRTPPKTQAALLEAMQEKHVTAAGRTMSLDLPFLVLATQNPIELEGTYPLPEAQLDRFMFNIVMHYLSEDDEVRVVTETTTAEQPKLERVLSGADIQSFQQAVRHVSVSEDVARYAVRLVDASRPTRENAKDFVKQWVKWGAGLRASQALVLAAKARALMGGRFHVSVADIKALAFPTLRHRIITTFYADSEQITPDSVIQRLLEEVPAPKSGL
jgi:MoxR-like ATPase